jgi:GT2 family glycosyltransferase
MDKENPLVSVIVRTKDRPYLLKGALRSIANQTYEPIEVVLVNDGGCDLDLEEIRTILGGVSLRYFRLPENRGRAHAGNVGIDNASGYFIGFLDDDDEFYPQHIEVLTDRLIDNPELRIIYTDAESVVMEVDSDNNYVETGRYLIYSQDVTPDVLLIQNFIPFMCLLFRRDVFEEVRIDESFDIFEDWKLLIDLSQKHGFEHIRKVTAKYIQWSDEQQINRRAVVEEFSKDAYKKVLSQNLEKITPEVLYTHCVIMNTDRMKLFNELIHERAEKERLHSALMGLRNYLAGSLGWELLNSYRGLKERLIPGGTRRRLLYDLLLKTLKVLKNEGFGGFYTRIRRRVMFKLNYLKFRIKIRRMKPVDFHSREQVVEPYEVASGSVQIIMPVFNGYEYLRSCIESILEYTDLENNELIIIDDKSTDERVTEYLRNVRDRNGRKKIRVEFNDENLGFVRTVNRGMKMSSDDVVLVNSDIVATRNWLRKLQRAAYSKPKVATSTPLSNYVTINGIPRPFRFNDIPGGMDIHTFAAFIDRISLRYYPEIPAGVGFCMYVKRRMLDEIGYFDEAKFEKGYAEETDFCMKALKKGYVHVLDDSTYIYHVGGVSFESIKDPAVLQEKNLMIERNLDILRTLHPEYMELVGRALSVNLKPVHQYIGLRIKLMERANESALYHRSEA